MFHDTVGVTRVRGVKEENCLLSWLHSLTLCLGIAPVLRAYCMEREDLSNPTEPPRSAFKGLDAASVSVTI